MLIILTTDAFWLFNRNPKAIPSVFGVSVGAVLSGSMYPAIRPGDAIIITKDLKNLKPQDIMTYYDGSELITHRILKINGDNIITEGDANNTSDFKPVQIKNIIGVYLTRILLDGYIIILIKGPLFIPSTASFLLFLFL